MSYGSRHRWQLLLLLLGIPVYIAFVLLLPNAPTVALVHAKTEQVSYVVGIPEMARIRLSGLSVMGEAPVPTERSVARVTRSATTVARETAPRKGLCVGGLLQPTAGTRVLLRRVGTEPLRIILERTDSQPAAEFRGGETPVPQELAKGSWLLVQENEECKGNLPGRFPIQGVAEVGDEIRPENSSDETSSAPLIEGRVEIFGKTIDLGLLTQDKRPRLYPVTEVTLPPGSRVLEAAETGKKFWFGMALLDKEEAALQVELTTEADTLAIFRPGSGSAPEILNIGMFAQLTSDPNIIFIQVSGAVLLGIIQILIGLSHQSLRNAPRNNN